MKSWPRRIRGAVGMALTWGVAGALVEFGIELIHNVWPNPLGALGGVLVSLGAALLVAVGLASIKAPHTLWQVTVTMMVPFALAGAASAAGSLLLARRAESRESLARGSD